MVKSGKEIFMERKKGFTLSETLITLAVLGIIIAATIPNLINTTNEHNYVNGLKKAYLILKTATSQIMTDNSGTMLKIAGNSSELLDKYCTRLNCVKKCSIGTSGCFFSPNVNNLQGNYLGWDIMIVPTAILSNGMLIAMSLANPNCTGGVDNSYVDNGVNIACGSFWVDVNGFNPPNRFGRDVFIFRITSKGLFPDGLKGFTPWSTYCDTSSIDSINGVACSGRILTEGTMNY